MGEDRKYRHRGYQESGERDSGPRPRSGPRPDRDDGAPRSRGIDQNKAVVFACRACGAKRREADEIRADSTCGQCGADLHACAQCTYLDGSARFECGKPVQVRIVSKKTRNACESYAPAMTFDLTGSRGTPAGATPDDARAAFDALFKK